jgi:hypothetical protein
MALAALLACADVWAQQQQPVVAHLKQVTGNVLVSREAGLATGNEAQPITNGSRIITTANSTAIVVFDNGCEVRLKENERLEVDSNRPCALMLVQAVGPAPLAAVGAPIMGTLLPVVIGTTIIVDRLDKNPAPTAVSPN